MTEGSLEYLYALTRMRGISDVKLSKILLKYGSAKDVYELRFEPSSSWEREMAKIIEHHRGPEVLDQGREVSSRLEDLGGSAITILDEHYPLGLLQLEEAPIILYAIGMIGPEDNYAVAIVGTRQASDAGRKSAHRLAEALAKFGITVLSGLALGIDTAAHKGALAGNGRTIAVIGSGLDYRYPKQNSSLWDDILAKDGAIVSQFPPGTSPKRWTFPKRNWTMSGMAQGTVVVEASHTSGAKLQAMYAAKQGRVLFLTRNQVRRFSWARQLAEQDKAIVIKSIDDIIDALRPTEDLSQVPDDLSVASSLIIGEAF